MVGTMKADSATREYRCGFFDISTAQYGLECALAVCAENHQRGFPLTQSGRLRGHQVRQLFRNSTRPT
jgi:hypothetical protein